MAMLLRMPVYQILTEMPYDELIGWQVYLSQRPAGWREDQRTMLLMQAAGVKQKPEQIFNSLAVMKDAEAKKAAEGLVAMSSFKQSKVFHFLSGTDLPPAFKE
jgi:hypothetical protein